MSRDKRGNRQWSVDLKPINVMENSNSINKPPSCSPNVRIFALNYSPTNDFNRIFDSTWLSLGRSVEHSNNTKCNFKRTRPNTFQEANDRSSRRHVTSPNDRYFAAVIEPALEIMKEPVLAQFIRCGWKIQRRKLSHGYAYYKFSKKGGWLHSTDTEFI